MKYSRGFIRLKKLVIDFNSLREGIISERFGLDIFD
jgi:hypothetical protein